MNDTALVDDSIIEHDKPVCKLVPTLEQQILVVSNTGQTIAVVDTPEEALSAWRFRHKEHWASKLRHDVLVFVREGNTIEEIPFGMSGKQHRLQSRADAICKLIQSRQEIN